MAVDDQPRPGPIHQVRVRFAGVCHGDAPKATEFFCIIETGAAQNNQESSSTHAVSPFDLALLVDTVISSRIGSLP